MRRPPLVILMLVALSGCSSRSQYRHVAESPSVVVAPTGEVKMNGDAPVPAKVNTSQTNGIMSVPVGSVVVFDEKLGTATLTLSKDTQIAVNRKETAVHGPVAFTPDKAPTISEELNAKSDAKMKIWYGIGMAVGVALAIFGLVRQWDLVMYGGVAIAGACAFCLFVQTHPVLFAVIGLGVAAAVIGPIIWHTKLKHLYGGIVS